MHRFQIVLSPKAAKDLDAFNDTICKRLTSGMKVLQENPFPKGKLIKKIKGTSSDYYRLRVDKYRIFYFIDADKIVILRVLSKKDVGRFIGNLN